MKEALREHDVRLPGRQLCVRDTGAGARFSGGVTALNSAVPSNDQNAELRKEVDNVSPLALCHREGWAVALHYVISSSAPHSRWVTSPPISTD